MKNLITRALAGAVFVGLIIGSILWNPLAAFAVFFVFNTIALWEYAQMFKKKNYSFPSSSLIFMGSIFYIMIGAFANSWVDARIFLLLIPLSFIFFISALYKQSDRILEELGLKILALLYIAIPFGMFNIVANMGVEGQTAKEPLFLIMFFVLVWASDTFAYLSGSAFGKHRLFERISPKKSWEGSIGGGLAAMIIAGLFGYYSSLLDPYTWALLALVIVISASFGDLVESLIKRQIGVKDSGKIMPGHGGILDRFDAAIFAIPFYVALLYFLS